MLFSSSLNVYVLRLHIYIYTHIYVYLHLSVSVISIWIYLKFSGRHKYGNTIMLYLEMLFDFFVHVLIVFTLSSFSFVLFSSPTSQIYTLFWMWFSLFWQNTSYIHIYIYGDILSSFFHKSKNSTCAFLLLSFNNAFGKISQVN